MGQGADVHCPGDKKGSAGAQIFWFLPDLEFFSSLCMLSAAAPVTETLITVTNAHTAVRLKKESTLRSLAPLCPVSLLPGLAVSKA